MEELIRQGKKAAGTKQNKKSRAKIELPQIDPRFGHIKKMYDVHALSLRCNSTKCKKKPSKTILISETIVRSKKSRDLSLLYLCDLHSKDMRRLETDLNRMSKGAMVSISMSDRK